METIKQNIKSNKIFIFWLILSLIFTTSIMILLYKYTSPQKSFTALESIGKDINALNSSLDDCIKGNTIDPSFTIERLHKNIDSIDKLKSILSSTIITDSKMNLLYTNLSSSIDSTHNLYIYCLNSLDSPNINSEYITELNNLKNSTLDSYKKTSSYGINLNYSPTNFEFYNILTNYLAELQKTIKHNVVKDLQIKDFFTSFNSEVENFSNLLEDIKPAVEKIREDNRSIDILIDDIAQKEIDFLIIKRNVNHISIPVECQKYYDSLIDSFTNYSTYLTAVKTALIYEKSSSSYMDNKKIIDKNYKNAYEKFADTKTNFESLKKAIDNF